MDLAIISLLALIVAIVLSCTTTINVGLLSLVFAWFIGVYLGGMDVKAIRVGFPTDLFLTLVGITLLFAQAQVNGTLERIAHYGVRGCRGNVGLIPLMFFLLALTIATVGAGNIAGAALVAPMAMAAASRVKIPAILMTIMIAHGALAGAVTAIMGYLIFGGWRLFRRSTQEPLEPLPDGGTSEPPTTFERKHWITI